jgi:hypothetical protein
MNVSKLKSTVTDFLTAPETDPEVIRKYMTDLQAENDRIIKRSGTDSTAIVLLAIFFLLIGAKGVGEFSLFGVKITQLDAVAIVIPPAIAGLLARVISRANSLDVIQKVYFEISKQAYPAYSRTSLDRLVIRGDIPFADDPSDFWAGSRAWRLAHLLSYISGLALLFLPFVFFVYSYYALFRQYHVSNVFVWIALLLTVLFIVLAIEMFFADVWET